MPAWLQITPGLGHTPGVTACADTPLPVEVTDRIAHVVTLSGLHDLRPLQFHSMNEGLRLDPQEAEAESPAPARVTGLRGPSHQEDA